MGLFASVSGQHRVALTLAQRFHALAAKRSDPNDRLIGERMIGVSQHYLGDQPSARRHLERVLADYVAPAQRSHIIRFQIDQRVAARAYPCADPVAAGISGSGDAHRRKQRRGRSGDRSRNLAVLRSGQAACPIALLIGDLAAAEHYVEMLLDHSTRHALARWHAFGRCYQGVLVIKRGDVVTGLRLLRAGFDELGEAGSVPAVHCVPDGRSLGPCRADRRRACRDRRGDRAIRAHRRTLGIAELLRIKGELLLLQGAPGAAATAEGHFRQALDWARRQGALSWELRAATSLARLWRDQGRTAEARELLQPVYDRFTEGFDTADLKAAKALIDDLR